jgi:rod shape-determining protein MreD
MMPNHRSRRILQPVRMWFVYLTLAVALLLSYIPVGRAPLLPDWTALVLVFWCVREPLRIGMSQAFVFGLLVDIGHGALMGQHAMAYVVMAYLASTYSRRVLWFSVFSQALHLLPVFLLGPSLMALVRVLTGGEFPGLWLLAGSVTATLLWGPLTYLLLLPQYQPHDRDENRPI